MISMIIGKLFPNRLRTRNSAPKSGLANLVPAGPDTPLGTHAVHLGLTDCRIREAHGLREAGVDLQADALA
jgi:hypothetical protein